MLGIAHNKAVSMLRKRRDDELEDDAALAIEDDADDPEVTAQKTDKGALLRACLDRLSDDHKTIVDLVYYQEMSIAEVAEIVGIPENTVKTRMFYARKKLSEFLKEAGVDRGWP
jgi:RNA polymerase sigma-70 factor (ECF subfamily)